MPLDAHIDENLDTSWNEVGDLTLVTGEDGIDQSIAIDVIEHTGLSIASLAPDVVEQRRGAIERVVRDNPFTQPPIDVIVAEIDAEEQRVDFDVTTRRTELTIST